MKINQQYDLLIESLTDFIGSQVTVITSDGQQIRPNVGKPSVLVEPPEISSDSYGDLSATWKIDIIAGTATTQPSAMFECMKVIDALSGSTLPFTEAIPVTYSAAGKSLAAYQVTINPIV